MFVTNHVLSGIAIGSVFKRQPTAAFLVGVGSHLLLDAVPHWGCDKEQEEARARFFCIAKRDGLLGLAAMTTAAIIVNDEVRISTIAAIVGAVLLDLDKPALHYFGINPFPSAIDRLHKRIQNESPKGMPMEVGAGLLMVTVDAMLIVDRRSQV